MALKKDITDEKGVKTRYHKIVKLEVFATYIVVYLLGYVNASLRDAEKVDLERAEAYQLHELNLTKIKEALADSTLSSDERSNLLTELNDAIVNTPPAPDNLQLHYAETSTIIDYFEPLSIPLVYQKLTESGDYEGAEQV